MRVKSFPEFFATYKIYEIVMDVLKKNLREKDAKLVITDLVNQDAKPNDFLKKLALVLKKHTHPTKASNILMKIKERLKELLDVEIEPREIILTKNGKAVLKVRVANRTEAMLKIRVGVEQIGRKYTAIIYDPAKSFGHTKVIKSQIVEAGKVGVFKFIIKPDIFGIQDIYELNKNKELSITLGIQAEADGIDGLKTSVMKVPVKIVKVKI